MKIIYDDETNLMQFFSGDVEICTTSVDRFDYLYSQGYSSLHTSFVPPAVRLISTHGSSIYVMFQQRPQYKRVEYTPGALKDLDVSAKGVFSYYLPIPWTLYVVQMNRNYMIENIWGYFMKNAAAENFESAQLMQIPMHNWYASDSKDNQLCRPIYKTMDTGQVTDLLTVINQVYNEVWTTGFNNDLHDTVDAFVNAGFSNSWIPAASRKAWVAKLHRDPSSFYDFYYRFWSTLSMEQVVNGEYKELGELRHTWNLTYNSGTVFQPTEFKARLLTVAQNSTML